MNEPFEFEENNKPCCCGEVVDYVRRNPAQVILAVAGVGLLVAVLSRSKRPEHRAMQLLEEIQHRVKEIAEPVYHRAVTAAEKGAAAIRDGREHLVDADLSSAFKELRGKLKHLFR